MTNQIRNVLVITFIIALVGMVDSSKEMYEARLAKCVSENVLTISTCSDNAKSITGITLN